MVIIIGLKIFCLRSFHNCHNLYQITLQLLYLLNLSFMGNQLHKVLQMIIFYFYKFHKVLLLHLMCILLLVILMFILPVFIISPFIILLITLIYLTPINLHSLHFIPPIHHTLHITHPIPYHIPYHFTHNSQYIKSPLLHHFLT